MTTAIALAYGKDVLCQIHANSRSIDLDFSLPHFRLIDEVQSWRIDAGWLAPPAECGKSSL